MGLPCLSTTQDVSEASIVSAMKHSKADFKKFLFAITLLPSEIATYSINFIAVHVNHLFFIHFSQNGLIIFDHILAHFPQIS